MYKNIDVKMEEFDQEDLEYIDKEIEEIKKEFSQSIEIGKIYKDSDGDYIIDIRIKENAKPLKKDVFDFLSNINSYLSHKFYEKNIELNIKYDSLNIFIPNAFLVKNIKSIELPKNLQEIEDNTFKDWSDLKNVNINSRIYAIGNGAFYNCSSLKEINLCEGMQSIESRAFFGCKNLISLNLPESLEHIGNSFIAGTNIKKIRIPKNIKKIDRYAFSGSKVRDFECDNSMVEEILYQISFYNKADIFSINGVKIECNGYNKFLSYTLDVSNNKSKLAENLTILFKNEILKQYFGDFYSTLLMIENGYNEDALYKNFMFFKEKLPNYNSTIIKAKFVENPKLYNCDIYEIIEENIERLIRQKIYPKDLIYTLFLGKVPENKQELKDIVNKLFEDGVFPKQIETLFLDEQELRDRLIYIKDLNLLRNNSDRKEIEEAVGIIYKSTFENIVERDNQKFNREKDNQNSEFNKAFNYKTDIFISHKFDGIKYEVAKKLIKINPDIIVLFQKSIEQENNKYQDMLNSIYEVLDFTESSKEKKQKQIYFKNKIIAKVLYALIKIKIDEDNIDINDIENLDFDFSQINVNDYYDKFFNLVNNVDFKSNDPEINVILNKMIQIDPYTFDILRDGKSIDINYYRKAIECGYIFDYSEIKDLNLDIEDIKKMDTLDSIARRILNDIEVSKIPEERKIDYLEILRKKVDEYLEDNNIDNFELFRSIDFYMRANSEYDFQTSRSNNYASDGTITNDVLELSKDIFDRDNTTYTNDDRLCYCLYNANKLAHSIEILNIRKDEINNTMYKNSTAETQYQRDMKNILSLYDALQSNGILVDNIDSILKNFNLLQSMPDSNSKYIFLLRDFEEKKRNELNEQLHNDKEQFNKSIEEIYNKINELSSYPREMVEQAFINAKEQHIFFDVKKAIAENLIKKLNDYAASYAFAQNDSIELKKEFYREHGFIIESKDDRGTNSLSCYNGKFNGAFNVHIPNSKEIVTDEKQVSFTKMPDGLTTANIIDQKNEIIQITETKLGKKMDGKNKRFQIDKTKLYNFLVFDSYVIKFELIEKRREFDELINASDICNNIEKIKRLVEIAEEINNVSKRIPVSDVSKVKFVDSNGNNISYLDKFYEEIEYNTVKINEEEQKRVEELYNNISNRKNILNNQSNELNKMFEGENNSLNVFTEEYSGSHK